MKNKISTLCIIAIGSLLFTGCGPSVQFVSKPDTTKPLNNTESIVHLKRAHRHFGRDDKITIYSNDKAIGEIANNDELIWKTEADKFECIGGDVPKRGLFYITLDKTPIAYKCFTTKSKGTLKLVLDYGNPLIKQRIFNPISYAAIFKETHNLDGTHPVALGKIINSAITESKRNLNNLLTLSIKNQFKENLVDSSDRTLDLEILEYKEGSAALRFLAESFNGSTFVKIKVTVKDKDKIIDTFITRPVIRNGGLATIGGDEIIFDEAAEDIFIYVLHTLK